MPANTPKANADALLQLARERFEDLTQAEEAMVRAAGDGTIANCTLGESDTDPAHAEQWSEHRVIRADRIAWLCTEADASARVSHHGIQVKAARIEGELDLRDAEVGFSLYFESCAVLNRINLHGAQVKNLYLPGTHTRALKADGLKVGGPVLLRNGFKADGEVRLVGATIGSNLECDASEFTKPEGYALIAAGVKVDGDVFLRNAFKAQGQVCLLGATIGGALDCQKGEFTNRDGKALNAAQIKVGQSVFLHRGFKARGGVSLRGASIGGPLDCEKGEFNNPNGDALSADGIKVDGAVYLRDGFKAVGRVDFARADVGGLQWHDVAEPASAKLDLRSARIGVLWDDEASWPESGNLYLQGLVYAELGIDAPTDAERRKRWLRLQPRFTPQPYEQLAKVLRESGHEDDAKEILIAKNQERAKTLSWRRRAGYWLFGVTTGYGYRPWLALAWLLLIMCIGWALFAVGFATGAMACTKKTDDYRPKPCALIYSADTFIPLINFHQADYWTPDAAKIVHIWRLAIPVGSVLCLYFWCHILFGWILTTLLVVGLTGMIRA